MNITEKKREFYTLSFALLFSILIHVYFLFFFQKFNLQFLETSKKKITISLSASGQIKKEVKKQSLKKEQIIEKVIPKNLKKEKKSKVKEQIDIKKIMPQKKSIKQKTVDNEKTSGVKKGIEGGVSTEILNQYVTQIYKLIDSKKNYPRQSLIRREEGVVMLQIIIRNDGKLMSVKSLKAKYQRLVDSSFDAVEEAAPFPTFPLQIKKKRMIIEVPVIYKIR